MNDKLKKIHHYAGTSHKGFRFLEILSIFSAVIVAVGIIFNPVDFRRILPRMAQSLGESNSSLALAVGVFAHLLLIIAIIHLAATTLKQIYEAETPFLEQVSKNVKWIGRMAILLGILPPVLLEIVSLFGSGTHIQFNLTYVVIGAVIRCLAFIMDYGMELQTQANETL